MALALVAALSVLANGCATHSLMVADPSGGTAVPVEEQEAAPRYRYARETVPFDNHVVGRGDTKSYSERHLTIPSWGDNGQSDNLVRARYLRSEIDGSPRPLVIVMPIYARFTYPSRKVAKFLQKTSGGQVHVLDVEGKDFLIDWVRLAETDDEQEFMEILRKGTERERTTVIDLRRLIDWAEERPEIDASRVAIIGFSRSAIVAGIMATQEPRLAASVLMMGGAHPHEIIARCDGVRTSAVQANVAKRFGWDQDELERRIRELFADVDPASYPGRVDPETVLIFEAARDECIPESARLALWETMGRPMTYKIGSEHRQAFIGLTALGGNWLCHRTWEFLQRRFELGDD